MNVTHKKVDPDILETTQRLKALEEEWRERKAARLYRDLGKAAEQLEARFAGYTSVKIEQGERAVIVSVGQDRELRLLMRLNFDEHGLLNRSYQVQDKQIRRRPDYEEVDDQYAFDSLESAVAFIARACD
ncbi:MAG: hypothetical protein PVG91_00345 [Gammaproteobacteria bacterium]|jgi:hypothetical protein